MAITVIKQPNNFTPAYNPVVFHFDSTNKNNGGFRYIVEVYNKLTSEKITELRVAPRTGDGYGVLDLSSILSTFVTYDLNQSANILIDATNSRFEYTIKVGEEYKYFWNFNDTQFDSGNLRFALIGAGASHTYVAGDQVVINQVPGGAAIKPQGQGLQTILRVDPLGKWLTIDRDYGTGNSAFGGTSTYADNRKIVVRDLSIINGIVFNAALSFSKFLDYNQNKYRIGTTASTTTNLLTNQPDVFTMTPTQDLFVNLSIATANPQQTQMYLTTDDGSIFWKSIDLDTKIITKQINVGPNTNNSGWSVLSGSLPIIKPTTKSYEFSTRYNKAAINSKTYKVVLDRRCKVEGYEILFLDRMGSFSSFSFQGRGRTSINVVRDMYNKVLDDSLLTTNAGQTIYNVDVEKEFSLNTFWMKKQDSIYFEELVTSPATFLKIDGKYFRCIIQSSNEPDLYKNLIMRTITLKLSNQDIINI